MISSLCDGLWHLFTVGEGRLEPVGIELKANRGGLGQEAERRKRQAQREKFLEQQHVKKMKMARAMQDSYRDTKISEQRQRRMQKYLGQSQRVCEQLDHNQVDIVWVM